MRAIIGNKIYLIDEDAILTLCKNETLDSASIRISNVASTDKLNLEPFDVIKLEDSRLGNRWLCVNTFVETMTCLNPVIYTYEIDLVSETKLLETIILPNLKITRMPDDNLKVMDKLNHYLEEYCPKIRIYASDSIGYRFTKKWEFSPRVSAKFSSVDCPEMQWSQPTLREVLTDLMMVKDCIPVIRHQMVYNGTTYYNVIDYMDLTEIGNDVSDYTETINYITRSQSSEDYVSELHMELQNVTNPPEAHVVTTSREEYVPYTTDGPIIDSDNVKVSTQYPIYELKHLYLMGINYGGYILDANGNVVRNLSPSGDLDMDGIWLKIDLKNVVTDNGTVLDLVPEYKKYNTKLDTYYDVSINNEADFISATEYKQYNLFYTRNTNDIDGFTNFFQDTHNLMFQTQTINVLLSNIIKYCSNDMLNNTPAYRGCHLAGGTFNPDFQNLFFEIEYETLESSVFRASKTENAKNERVVVDNQTNAMVNSLNQGFLEYQKANRLGNLQLQINGRTTGTPDIDLSDYYVDSNGDQNVIYQIQYQIYSDHIEMNAIATKNYVLRNYFTGVKSKIRSWAIEEAEKAVTRHDLNKFYLEFSYNEHTEGMLSAANNISYYFLRSIIDTNPAPLKGARVYTTHKTGDTTPSLAEDQTYKERYLLDLVPRIIGNSIVLTFGFRDNYWVDKSIDVGLAINNNTVDTTTYGGLPTKYYRYTDGNGMYSSITYDFVTDYNTLLSSGMDYDKNTHIDLFYTKFYRRPLIDSTYGSVSFFPTSNLTINKKKDSQEIIKISTQFEVCSDTKDIVIGKKFLTEQKAVRTTTASTYYLSLLELEDFNFRNVDVGSIEPNTNVTFTTPSPKELNIMISVSDVGQVQETITNIYKHITEEAIALTDANRNLLFALKEVPTANVTVSDEVITIKLRLNTLLQRDKTIYESQSNQVFKSSI